MSTRRSILEIPPALDTSGFKPKSGVDPSAPKQEAIREVAESVHFSSREASTIAPTVLNGMRLARRPRSGRTAQFAAKASPGVIDRFYKIADKKEWLIAVTFERAVAALEREIASEN